MRPPALILVGLLVALDAGAQGQTVLQPGAAPKQGGQVAKFRKSGIRPATQRTGAAARKRAPSSSVPAREGSAAVADRLAMQLDLAWTGDYTGLINGESNEKTTAAIKAFQRNRKFKESGVLNTQERALLAAAAKAKQARVGWSMVDDAVTGARLGIPMKQVPNKSQSKVGTHWSSAQGQVQVETFRTREPGITLIAVYEQQKKQPSTRKLETNVLRGDFFLLSGMQGLKKFYVRADFKDGEARGMTVLYDQATENIMDPVAVVMASAFAAFPSVTGVAQIGSAPKRKVEYGTGIVVSEAGHILTDRALTDGCNVIVVSGYGDTDRQAEDRSADLALLRVYGASDLAAATFAIDGANGPDLTLVGILDPQSQGGGGAISATTARLKGDTLEPAPQLGFSGAAALDGQGRLIGMIELGKPVVAAVGTSAAPAARATMIPAETIRLFLDAWKLPPVTARYGLDSVKASLVRVICVRK